MLMDYLGIVIGFVSVMLVFSLVVTALVQLTQSWLRLRAKNLLFGVQTALRSTRTDTTSDGSLINSRKMLLAPLVDPFEKREDAAKNKWLANHDVVTTWLNETDFAKLCSETDLTESQQKEATETFRRIDPWLKSRFKLRVRMISVAWAAIVAVSFQLSTPDLIRKLGTDPEFLEAATTLAKQQVALQASKVIDQKDVLSAAERALEELEEKHPEMKAELEELAGVGSSEDELLEELSLVLADLTVSNANEVRDNYRSFLRKELEADVEKHTQVLKEHLKDVSMLNLQLWPDPKFFSGENMIENIVGVLIAIIMLTFGAPFWFEQLNRLAGLRDVLSPVANKV